MTNVIIVHGTESSPERNWFPWLKGELEKLGCRVFVPCFPTPEGQSLSNWLRVFKEYERYFNEDAIVVGHSIGPAFLLNVLERREEPVRAAFFVAGFTGHLGLPEYDPLLRSFAVRRFDWAKISRNCKRFYVLNSDDDPYVPLEKGRELAKRLGVELIVIPKGGHLNQDAGYTRFDRLLELITREL